MTAKSASITRLLGDWTRGDTSALEELLPIVYAELAVARRELRREQIDHTLQPTALINELYLRLVNQRSASWENRAQFFAVVAQLMRRILVDHARAQAAAKRGGSAPHVSLSEADDAGAEPALEVLAVDQRYTACPTGCQSSPHCGAEILFRPDGRGNRARSWHLATNCQGEWRLAKAWVYEQLCRSIRKPGRPVPRCQATR